MLQTGQDWVAKGFKTQTVHLADGERVIGYKSRTGYSSKALHYDFQLLIGRPI